MKRMLDKSVDEECAASGEAAQEERSVLSSLRGHGKQHKVGATRVGAAKKADGPGVLHGHAGGAATAGGGNKFAIFQDGKASAAGVPDSSTSSSLPFGKERNRENEQDAGKWTGARIGRKAHAVPLDQISSKPAFTVHQDEGLETPLKPANCVAANVLSAQKPAKAAEDHHVALALFEPPDPSKKPMYCKHLVCQCHSIKLSAVCTRAALKISLSKPLGVPRRDRVQLRGVARHQVPPASSRSRVGAQAA